jgi:hypothetical protein
VLIEPSGVELQIFGKTKIGRYGVWALRTGPAAKPAAVLPRPRARLAKAGRASSDGGDWAMTYYVCDFRLFARRLGLLASAALV